MKQERRVKRYKQKNGYIAIYLPEHPQAMKQGGWVYEHRVVLEKRLGRFLKSHEHVHHIDSNRENNLSKNLRLILRGDHTRLHWSKKTKKQKFIQMRSAWNSLLNGFPKRGKSKYKGITKDRLRNMWIPQIRIGADSKRLGRFKTQKEAALVYDAAVRKYRKGKGYLNFPNS